MSSFLTNIIKLFSASLLAQAIGIILIPVITRLYLPSDLGVLNQFIAISSTIAIVSCLCYELSIMLPEKDEDAANLVVLCILLTIFTCFASGVILIFFSAKISMIFNSPLLNDYILLIPVMIFITAFFSILNYWLTRKKRFESIGIAGISNSSTSRLIQIGTGLINPVPIGLLSGHIIGLILANILMLKKSCIYKNFVLHISITQIKILAKRYHKFPKYSTWSVLSNTISSYTPIFLLSGFFSTTIVGFYSAAFMIAAMPMSVVGNAVSQVFFQKASEEKNKTNSVKSIVNEVHQRLVSFGLFPIIILMIISESLLSFVLGPEWHTAGTYVKLLAPWLFFVFIAAPLSQIVNILEKQGTGLLINITVLSLRVIALTIGGITGNPLYAIGLFSAVGVLSVGIGNYYILKISNVELIPSFTYLMKSLLLALFISLPVLFIQFLNISFLITNLAILVTGAIYYYIIINRDEYLKNEIYKALYKCLP